ncbi:penicillin-binding protein 1A [Balneatrix alpica]|uniref:penicillin-binding protein 1A n=1 Tax=Balneatrix alpica TaxID=75684 RepID=UPI00273A1E4A|nr:penicillin-binding protein 1A [Balneatrix alpica]
MLKALIRWFFWLGLFLTLGIAVAAIAMYQHFAPQLPDVETLRTIQLQTPLRIYSADGKLIGEFGEKRRTPISYEQIPPLFIKALYAAEDSRFESHNGIDVKGLSRAALQLIQSGSIQTGGSTITQQVAKNYFLTRERTFSRKFAEILLALDMEQKLSKNEIMELYVNKIYLGNRAYGIEAAAQVYYGKSINELTLAQLAMIAGLPKAPSAYNPIANPERAMVRRDWILGRMLELSYIDDVSYEAAIKEPNSARFHGLQPELDAPYVAEMVRTELIDKVPDLYEAGYHVYTTVDSRLQNTAQSALANGLLEYEERHGYRGPEQHWQIDPADFSSHLSKLKEIPTYFELKPALVTLVTDREIEFRLANGEHHTMSWKGMEWARKHINVDSLGPKPQRPSDILQIGDVIRVRVQDQRWHLSQLPVVQGALVSLHPDSGAILALSGGFNFYHSNFNRATQARRQPGSNLKPFIYAAALEKGFTPASIINDAPVVYDDPSMDQAWRPENSGGKFFGPTRMREALYHSRNLVSIRLLRAIGLQDGISYLARFGFDPANLPRGLSLALGTASITPLELATGYAALANGGYKVSPYLIERVEDVNGQVLMQTEAARVCHSDCPTNTDNNDGNSQFKVAERIMDERANFLLTDMLMDVIRKGTGRKAQALKRSDLAGKTGTTNDQVDAWFSGYNPDVVTSVWVGYDQPSTLGKREFGAAAALPVWMDYMAVALENKPERVRPQPAGLVSVRIDPNTGERALPNQDNAIFELFPVELEPKPLQLNAQGEVVKPIRPEDLF